MSKQHSTSSEAGYILTGVIAWLIASTLLLLLSAVVVYTTKPEEASLGYFVSAISFLSATVAGFSASKKKNKALLYTGLIIGCTVICFALTLGFVIAGNRITADSVLSLVTFTLAGCMAGCIIPTRKEKRNKKKFPVSGKRA